MLQTAINPYASGVLTEEAHSRLVKDIDGIASSASIQPHWIWTPLAEVASPAVVDWVRKFRQHRAAGSAGLCLTGTKSSVASVQMSAITGAMLRNFVNAKMITVGELHDRSKTGTIPDVSVLLIPNFFLGAALGGSPAKWEVEVLRNTLMDRQFRGVMTVIYVSDIHALAVEYGSAVAQLVKSHYTILPVTEG